MQTQNFVVKLCTDNSDTVPLLCSGKGEKLKDTNLRDKKVVENRNLSPLHSDKV